MSCMILHNCKLVLQRRTHVQILLQNILKINIYVLLQGAELKHDTALVQQQLFINNLLPNTILQQLLCFCLTTTCTDIFCQPCDKTKYTSCHSRIYVLTPPTYLDPFCFIWFWDSVIDLDSKNPEIGSFGQRSIWVQQQLVSNKKRPTNRSQLPGTQIWFLLTPPERAIGQKLNDG